MTEPEFIPLPPLPDLGDEERIEAARAFRRELSRRRTVRDFTDRAVPREVVEEAVRAAGTAPSGANFQPWHFALVSDPALKRRIREGAEAEEREFYENRAPPEWLEAIAPLGTDSDKPFLETAPWLVAIFVKPFEKRPDGRIVKHYYAVESTGIACGILITAFHRAGLATLTHTPSPMGFLNGILGRPKHEKPFLLLVVGHPAPDARVPDISRKDLSEIASFH